MTKNKRMRDLPKSFQELRKAIEKQIQEERPIFSQNPSASDKPATDRDFIVRYYDGDQEIINVSDDDDLLTAYDVAEKELGGKLNLKVDFKLPSELTQEYYTQLIQGMSQNSS